MDYKFNDTTAVWIGKIVTVNRWHKATCYRNKARIFQSKEYKEFKQSLSLAFRGMEPIEGYVNMKIKLYSSRRMDTGNVDKPIGDALEDAGILKNDKFIHNIEYIRYYHPVNTNKSKYLDAIFVEILPVSYEENIEIEKEMHKDVFKLKFLEI